MRDVFLERRTGRRDSLTMKCRMHNADCTLRNAGCEVHSAYGRVRGSRCRVHFALSILHFCVAFLLATIASAAPQKEAADSQSSGSGPGTASIRITSPLGRTGVITKVRIVAQVRVPPGQSLSQLSFFVDGTLVGTSDPVQYASVVWTDEDPFEP